MRQTRFTEIIAAAQPGLSTAPPAREAAREGDQVVEAKARILHIVADSMACGAFGLLFAAALEGLTNWRIDGLRCAYICSGGAGVITRIAGSRTIHEWRDWAADVCFARSMQQDQREYRSNAWQRVQTAQQVAADLSAQPSAQDATINRTIVSVLWRYYDAKARGLSPGRLWSRRALEARYGLTEFSHANGAVRAAIQPLEDGNDLRPASFDDAFRLIFGADFSAYTFNKSLVRVGDNPARREPVFVPKRPGPAPGSEAA